MNVVSFSRTLLIALILIIAVPAVADVHGVLRVVKGDVQIKSGSTGKMTKARLGQEVYPKDTIITAKDARAKIVMIDNNEINVSPESNVEIQNYEYNPAQNKKDVLLNVLYGKVRSKVEQKYDGKTSKFQVKTPAAVAGVRGTDFMTSYDPATKNSQVVTFRGKVEFGLPGPNGTISNAVAVTPGKMASAAAGGAPSAPANVPKEQLAKMDHESKAESSGSTQDSRTPAQDKKGKDSDHKDNNGNSGSSGSGAGKDSGGDKGNSGGSSNSGSNGNSNSASGSGANGAGNGSSGSTANSSSGSTAPAPANAPGGESGSSASNGSTAPQPAAAAPSSSAGGGESAGASPSANGGGNAGPAPSTAANDSSGSSSGSDTGRSPASTGGATAAAPSTTASAPPPTASAGGSMLQTGDLASSSANSNMANIPKSPSVPSMSVPFTPIAGVNPNPTQCQFCNQVIQSGSSKLIIHINP